MNRFQQYQMGQAMTAAAENPSGGGAADGMGLGLGMAMASRMMPGMAAQPAGAPAPPPPPPAAAWHVAVDGQTRGPFSLAQMAAGIASGEVTRDTVVWTAGMDGWLPAHQVSQLGRLLRARSAAAASFQLTTHVLAHKATPWTDFAWRYIPPPRTAPVIPPHNAPVGNGLSTRRAALPRCFGILRVCSRCARRLCADSTWLSWGQPQWHQFPGEAGVTGLYLLSESHFAVHTYPERQLATLNLYCCRQRPEWPWDRFLKERLSAAQVCVRSVPRGADITLTVPHERKACVR